MKILQLTRGAKALILTSSELTALKTLCRYVDVCSMDLAVGDAKKIERLVKDIQAADKVKK